MFQLEINLKNDIISDVKKKVQKLDNREVKVGMFSEQGKHYSGYTYVELFKYLSEGDFYNNLPPRSPLEVVAALVPLVKSPLQKDLARYLNDLSGKATVDVDSILNNLGKFYRDEVREVFGDSGKISEKSAYTKSVSNSPDTPLIETGDLSKKVAYKIDNGNINEVGR